MSHGPCPMSHGPWNLGNGLDGWLKCAAGRYFLILWMIMTMSVLTTFIKKNTKNLTEIWKGKPKLLARMCNVFPVKLSHFWNVNKHEKNRLINRWLANGSKFSSSNLDRTVIQPKIDHNVNEKIGFEKWKAHAMVQLSYSSVQYLSAPCKQEVTSRHFCNFNRSINSSCEKSNRPVLFR